MRLKTLFVAAAALAFASATTAQTPPAGPSAPAPAATPAAAGDLIVTMRSAGQFTTFLRLLNSVNLTNLLKTQPGLTVFAPTDAAFAALPPGELDALAANKPALQKRLMHHLVNAKINAASIKGAQSDLPTGAQDNMNLDGTGPVLKADNGVIVQTDLVATNGVIQVVDHFLVSTPAAPVTPEATAPATTAKPG